jgi:predicted acyl esterase
MTDNRATEEVFRVDSNGAMTIEWDVPIEVSDGLVLRADIFRPSAPGRYPVIASYGPYGKGLPFKELMPDEWQKLVSDHPDVLEGSSGQYQVYELADPEKWVPDGYVCVRVDVREQDGRPGTSTHFPSGRARTSTTPSSGPLPSHGATARSGSTESRAWP